MCDDAQLLDCAACPVDGMPLDLAHFKPILAHAFASGLFGRKLKEAGAEAFPGIEDGHSIACLNEGIQETCGFQDTVRLRQRFVYAISSTDQRQVQQRCIVANDIERLIRECQVPHVHSQHRPLRERVTSWLVPITPSSVNFGR